MNIRRKISVAIYPIASPARLSVILFLLALFSACNPTKKLQPGQYIVDKVEVIDDKLTDIPKEEFEAYFRQKPNRKFLRKIDFFVWWYNLFDDEKIAAKKQKRNQDYDEYNSKKVRKFEKKNQKRIKKGKKPKAPKLKDKESTMLIESVRDIGEPAVILDSGLVNQTRYQLSRFLFSKGYFNNEVKDSVTVKAKNRRAHIRYTLIPKQPYTIARVIYDFDDDKIAWLIREDSMHCLLKPGDIYDFEKQQAEKQRLTDLANNNGYYYYENAYTGFQVDSGIGNHRVNVQVRIKKFTKTYSASNDSLVYRSHPRLTIANVFIITESVVGNVRDLQFNDTLKAKKNKLLFLLNQKMPYRESLITDNVSIYKDGWFKRDSAEFTYKQLLGLGVFKNVTIQFYPNRDNSNQLDCFIICSPLIKQSITLQPQLTNTYGNLGIDGSFIYQNKNLFKGGELLELKLAGSIAAQAQFNSQSTSGSNIEQLPQTFNTIQFGPELTFAVPRAFFPFSLLPFKKEAAPRTYIKSGLNYQSRPEFSRIINSIDYGFTFKSHNNKYKHDIIPLEVYFVRAILSAGFKNTLDSYNDAFLVNSFQDHVTTLSKYAVTYVSKENSNTSSKHVNYIHWSIQSSGTILRQLFEATNQKRDSLDRYLIMGIPFAQFIRTDIDYRHYIPVRKKSRVVYRLAGGIGKPLKNLSVLPYEQSFFSGGPNSVRAWRARTLGPGGYDPSSSTARFDKIGDLLLEGNFEYRFHIIKSFNGAFFVDAGNIWRLNPDAAKPNAEFLLNKFTDQIAIGTGVGIRWDLNFFVLRLDVAAPLKDPKLPVGDRWTFDKKPWNYSVVNFGIGYPF